jgi:cytochrome c-type biogenesis protein CcmE
MFSTLAPLAKTRIALALFALLIVVGAGLSLAACATSAGVKGAVASVDLAHSRFVLALQPASTGVTSLTVHVSPQTEFRGALHGLADLQIGMEVSVQGMAPTSGGTLEATEVQDQPEHDANDQGDQHDAAAFTGTVQSVDSAHSSFVLALSGGTQKIVTVSAETEFKGGLHRLSDLSRGLRVEVKGTLQANGTIVASSVEADHENEDQPGDVNRLELAGTVSSVNLAGSAFVLALAGGTLRTIVVTSQTDFEDGLHGLADLTRGQPVEVRGTLQTNGMVLASSVEANSENDNQPVELTGTISSIHTAQSSFVLRLGDGSMTTVVTTAQTEFDGGFNGFADVRVGLLVEVRGTLQSNGSLLAAVVHREDSGDGSSGESGDGSGR